MIGYCLSQVPNYHVFRHKNMDAKIKKNMLIPVLESVMNLICLHSSEFYFACHSFFMSYYGCACCFHLIKFRADEELVDQKKYLEDSCKPKCVKPLLEYEVKHFHNLICHFFFPSFLFSKHANEYHS